MNQQSFTPHTGLGNTGRELARISAERYRQTTISREILLEDVAVGDLEKLPVLLEEVGEVARAINDEEGIVHLREELIQVAAVAVAWAESLTELLDYMEGY